MLTATQVAEVRALLGEGRNQCEISRTLGLARGTVAKIASGRYPDHAAIRRVQEQGRDSQSEGPIGKCPACGHRVHLPCQICRARAARTAVSAGRASSFQLLDEPLGLQLQPKHQRRYEEIRKDRGEA